VYVVKSDNTVDQRVIVLGQRQGDQVVVEKGLSAGEIIVQTGQQLLQPGGKVTVQKPAAGMGQTAGVGGEGGNS
jgi:multidrug efflux pump subunit AcrA (membrane-fusion protein)